LKRNGLAFWCALIICLMTGSIRAQQQQPGHLTIEPYVFKASDGQEVEAELGKLLARENRSRADSRLIELAFVRFKSTAAKPGPPIVYLAGGPGGSGIATARGSRFPLFMAMREIGDVIAFDQRATGMSRPSLTCRESLDYPLDKPGEPNEILRLYKERARSCAAALKAQGIDLSAYNTNESADDLDDLRKALGAETISLWSISYGTHLALATIRRHERNIHRVILAGVEGPEATLKLPSQIQQQLEKINQLAKADPGVSGKVPDLIELMKSVFAQLDKQPITIQTTDPRGNQQGGRKIGVTIGKFDLQRITASVIGNNEVRQLPVIYYALSKGETSGLMLSILAQQVGRERAGSLGSAMPVAMDCASGVSPRRLRRIENETKQTLLGATIDYPFPDVCAAVGVADLGEAFRSPVKAKTPALFISGTLDARTPVSNAEDARKGFPNSAHLIIDGAVHSDPLFLSSPQIKDVMLEFLKGQPVSTTSVKLQPLKFAPIQ